MHPSPSRHRDHPAPPRTRARRARPRTAVPTSFLVALAIMLSGTPGALAQAAAGNDGSEAGGSPAPGGASAEAPLVAVHYEDLLDTEPASITLFFPRPLGAGWQVVEPISSDACLRVDRVAGSDPEHVLVVEADVRFEAADVAAGSVSPCRADVTIAFAREAERWTGTARVIVNRVHAPELPYPELGATMTSEPLVVPRLGAAYVADAATLLTLTLHNPFEDAITVQGVSNPAAFASTVGAVHPHDPASFDGTYATLVAITQDGDALAIAPGSSLAFGLVLDPAHDLPDGAGTLTIRPAALVERGGTVYASPFPRVSLAWGNELP